MVASTSFSFPVINTVFISIVVHGVLGLSFERSGPIRFTLQICLELVGLVGVGL
uniref:Uncharacterized protein n=1 Tax=Anguilla anguilla TaxID=7936 RepID=A0A0E9QB92_ANGAN